MSTIELEYRAVAATGGDDATAALVTLNRPEQLNPVDSAMLGELDRALDAVEARRSARGDVRAVLVTGGGRAVSAGGGPRAHQALPQGAGGFPPLLPRPPPGLGRPPA